MNKLKIHVIIGSTRKGRFGDKPAKWIFEEAKKRFEFDVELIDLRDYPLPFFDEAVSPSMNKGVYSNKQAAAWAKKVGEADGYIWVTPEYNHSTSAVLKNALDYAYPEWNRKPVAFVAYGSMGGARAVEHLIGIAAELQMATVRAAVYIPAYWNHLDEFANLKTEPFQHSAELMLEHLSWWTKTLKEGRKQSS
ncbi:NAD(P)H-dependent oxidoreductase [soil metagenome]